jgi:hypothetical protein
MCDSNSSVDLDKGAGWAGATKEDSLASFGRAANPTHLCQGDCNSGVDELHLLQPG